MQIGGVSATAIAEEFGTPVYVYDAEKIRSQYNKLDQAFSGFPHHLHYALKANSNLNILKLLRKEGAGLDAVSLQEVELGLAAGYPPEEILFTPNSVSFSEIRQAVEMGIRINIDNLSILEQFGNEFGGEYPVCIRVNPHIYAGGNAKISVGHIDSKFGISVFQMRHVLRIVKSFGLNIEGLHMHTGSDILDTDVFLQAAEVLFNAAHDFPNLKYLDFGSGFKVRYKPDDNCTDVEALGQKLEARLKTFYEEYGREIEIWFEPGKFFISEAGHFLVKVNTIKQTVSSVFVGVNSGLNHLIRPMLYDAYHHILNVSNPDGTPRVYSIVGYICETDTFAYDRQLPEVREGDILSMENAGAYSFTMASNYNSRLRPAEVLVDGGKAHLIRRRENLDDLLRAQIILH